VVAYLQRQNETVAVCDSRQNPPGLDQLREQFPEVDYRLGEWSAEYLCQAQRLIVSPGVSLHHPALLTAAQKGVEIIGDVELFARVADKPVIAVTGTNGKSTVVKLVEQLLLAAGQQPALGGNFGTPALDLLSQPASHYVLELSSYQLETTKSLQPSVAAVLNITPDHLDRYQTFSDYVAAKQLIYTNAKRAVYGYDDPLTTPPSHVKSLSFGLGKQADFHLLTDESSTTYLAKKGEPLMAVDELRLVGTFNWLNVLAALAIVDDFALPWSSIQRCLQSFQGLAHRCQWVRSINGVDWYNDSKGTNVGATQAAITALNPRPLVLIAGGQAKGQDFTELAKVAKHSVKACVLFGEDAAKLKTSLALIDCYDAEDLAVAVTKAHQLANHGDAVLFSPACASFDMFRDYQHRGEQFCQQVHALDSKE